MANKKINGGTRGGLTNDPSTPAPRFNFYEYTVGHLYHNNETEVDFVTYDGSLYVCAGSSDEVNGQLVEGVYARESTPERNGGFLLIVKKGEDGAQGVMGKPGKDGSTPEIKARFEGKHLVIYDAKTQSRISTSPELTGPTWKPVQKDNKITWKLEEGTPNAIDLDQLRPVEEHPVLFRLDSDNTKRSDEESGPGYYIQWKREGAQEWTNLMSISELMNIALAGVSFWWADDEHGATDNNGDPVQRLHFGHREVVSACYDASKLGNKRIAEVELGEVLFDAGEVPFANYDDDIAALNAFLCDLQGDLAVVRDLIPSDYVRMVNGRRPNNNGEIILDDYYSKIESDSKYLTASQLKTLGGQSLVGSGNLGLKTINGSTILTSNPYPEDITVGTVRSIKVNNNEPVSADPATGMVQLNIAVGGNVVFDVKIENNHLYKTTDGVNWTDLGAVNTGNGGANLTDLKLRVGDPNDNTKRNHLFVSYDNGVTWTDAGEFIDTTGQNVDLTGYATWEGLGDLYYTKTACDNRFALKAEIEGVEYYRTFTIYKRTNSNTTAPAVPLANVTAVWDVANGVLTLPQNYTEWKNHPDNATTQTPYLWMTSATFRSSDGSMVDATWETPICLTGANGANGQNGHDGSDGADGDSVEFIYTLVTDLDAYNQVETPVYEEEPGGGARGVNNDEIPDGWTDHPQGMGYHAPKDITTVQEILDQNTEILFGVEVGSVRTKSNGVWGEYCAPFIWSMWGEDGVDGDGVEYIFLATSDPIIAAQYPPTKLREIYNDANNQDVSAEANDNNIDYAHPKLGFEYYDTREFIPNGWTDNPSDVDEQQPYEYVSLRRYNGTTGHWSAFTTPKKWRMYKVEVQAAESHYYYQPYTEFAFTRTSKDLTGYTVSGGQSYANPLDGIVTRNANNQVDNSITWTDGVPSNSDDQIWVITALIGDESQQQTNVWTGPWKLGDRAGVQVEYSNDPKAATVYSNPSLWNSHNLTLNDFSGTDEQRETLWEAAVRSSYGIWSDYVVDPIYMAMCTFENGSWSDWTIAKVKGEKGNKGDTGPQGQNGSDGADGKDIEFVYFRTDDEHHAPGMSQVYGTYDGLTKVSEDLYADDFLPMVTASGFSPSDEELKIGNDYFWHDHPAGVTLQLPCEWVGVRHSSYQNGQKVWGNFNIALWAKYGEKGRDGDGVEYVFWDLTEEQAGAVSGNVYPTRLADTNYTDNHSPAKHINESECLPSITLTVDGTATTLIAKDDNPGVSDQKPYVYASMRKWRYDSVAAEHKWGEFSAIKLWLIKEIPDVNIVTLDIEDDHKQIVVDDTDHISTSELNFSYATGRLSLYNNLNLLSTNSVWVNDVKLAEVSSQPVVSGSTMEVTNNTVQVTNRINGVNVTATVSARYATKLENSLTASIALKVAFPANTLLNEPFIIPVTVKDPTGDYAGTANIAISPTRVKGLELKSVPGVVKMTTSESYDDLPSTLSFWGTPIYGTIENVMYTNYWFTFDNGSAIRFCLNNAQLQDALTYDTGTVSRTLNYYFDLNGPINTSGVASEPSHYLFKIKLNNVDYNDNSDPWRRWTCHAYVNVDEILDSGGAPHDSFYFAIGLDNVITDYAVVPIVSSGRNAPSTEIVAIVETTSDNIVIDDQNPSGGGGEVTKGQVMRGGAKGGGQQQQEGPVIEIGPGGQVDIIDNGDGTTTITDGSGDYSVLNFSQGTVNKFQILKVTTYDEYNVPSVEYVASKIQTVESIPSWYLIKDAFYYTPGGYDELTDTYDHPINKTIYALIVDNGELQVLTVGHGEDSSSSDDLEPAEEG